MFQPSKPSPVSPAHAPARFAPRLRLLACAALALHAPQVLGAQARPDTVQVSLLLASHPWLGDGGRFADVQRAVSDARAGAPALRWSTAGTASAAIQPVLAHIRDDVESTRGERADADRLEAEARRLSGTTDAATLGLFDLAMDIAVARHAYLHRQGRIDPTRIHAEWSLAPAELDLAALRTALASGAAAGDTFRALEPQTRSYGMLVSALADARRQDADTAEQRPMAPARPISAGGRYADAQPLARVLVRLGELPASFDAASVHGVYTRPMADAVSRFQNRKLKKGRVTGTLTAPVFDALMDAYDERASRIAMAIERWRWLPRTFSNDPLVVNLPEFRLHTYGRFQGDSADALSMNVVIGRADSNATPVFAANMTQVVFSPQWHVPKSIMLKEILPAATANAGYIARNNYELTTPGGRVVEASARNIARIGTGIFVRQRSGDANSLGRVKFLLPNPYDIYLHDTPSRSLFARNRRDFSHGCVRLGNPMAMAKYVLANQPAWTESKITEAMNAGIERYVRVQRPIPVLIVYQTAVAEPDGSLRYFNDVYGHDAVLADALDRAR
ncbi:MAG: L,D-transpeptidase family protein [Gemmatimonadaceae bacterium]|nr:L,D-transpeptidase family protein [Gemmatimonadaceae bacterium]